MSDSTTVTTGVIESRDEFERNPQGQYKYWLSELESADDNIKAFIKQGDSIVKRYVAESKQTSDFGVETNNAEGFNLNLFYANTKTLEANLYGNVPTVDVSRRFSDATDDVGRVAAEIMERLLNDDLAVNGQACETTLRTALQDRLIVGLGVARVRYDAAFDAVKHEAVVGEDGKVMAEGFTEEQLISEAAPADYVHWRDVRWGWARTWSEVPWVGFRAYLTKDEVEERFDEEVAKKLTYKRQQAMSEDDSHASDDETSSAWQKAEIWEIWDKGAREVVWVSKGYDKVLDTQEDPLGLDDFYPCPPFFLANPTSTLYIPTSDYHMAQDLYNEVDRLQTRIAIITEAVKVVGLYDAGNESIARMFKEGTDNDLIPVDNWALFAEKGGMQGVIDWFPIGDVVSALEKLIAIRDQTIALLQQITGMSDLMRGELGNQYEGVGQTQIKAQFGSVRIQELQDRFAQFASDLFSLKAEIISKHFEPQTIAAMSNIQHSFDAELAEPAIMLIKDYKQARLQTKIRPESVAMVDYAQLKSERTEYLNALATFMQSAAPLIESDPAAKPFLLQLLQWGLAGFKGASEIEGVIDKAISASEQAAKEQQENPPQDPAVQVEQMRQGFEQQMEQLQQQGELAKIQAKAQADIQVRQNDGQADAQTIQLQQQADIQLLQGELMANLAEVKAKLQADIRKEVAQAQANIMQTQAAGVVETEKDVAQAKIEVAKEADKTALKIDEIGAQAKAKVATEGSKEKPSNDKQS